MKRSYEGILSAGLIRMSLMHSGREDFLVQENTFQRLVNLGSNSVGAWKPVRASPSGSTQSSNTVDQRLTKFLATYKGRVVRAQLGHLCLCFNCLNSCVQCLDQRSSTWSESVGHGGCESTVSGNSMSAVSHAVHQPLHWLKTPNALAQWKRNVVPLTAVVREL